MSGLRIAVGGIAHETNTFSSVPTEYSDFLIVEGAQLISGPGWGDLDRDGIDIVPLFSAHASPSGVVTRDAFERLLGELIEGMVAASPLDGILLTLHGAMVVETLGDGETAILEAIREAFGEDLFVTVTLDLHANLAPYVAAECSIITAYRTAPHRDAEETRLRGMRSMIDCLINDLKPTTRMVKLPLLVGGEAAVTEVEPAKSCFALLAKIDARPGIVVSSILIGCAWTDSAHTGVAAVVSGTDEAAIEQATDELAEELWSRRTDFTIDSITAGIDDSVRTAQESNVRPVFISDSGDNTTAGAAGDTPTFIRYFSENGTRKCLVAGITDPVAAKACADAGIGAKIEVSLGGKLDSTNGTPFACTGVVESLSDSNGPRALMRIDNVDVVVQSDRRPFTELGHFAELDIEPTDYKIIVVKEGYLFPELRDYAQLHIMAISEGFGDQRLDRLPYKKLQRPIYPFDEIELE